MPLTKKQTADRASGVKNGVENSQTGSEAATDVSVHTRARARPLVNYLTYIKNIYGSEIFWIENNVKLGTSSSPREYTHKETNVDFNARHRLDSITQRANTATHHRSATGEKTDPLLGDAHYSSSNSLLSFSTYIPTSSLFIGL